MNIVNKMKTDWNRRALHHAQYWIATEAFHDDEKFSQSGQQSARELLVTIAPYYDSSWTVLDIGCGIGRMLKPLAKHFQSLVGIDVSGEMIRKSKKWLKGLENVTTLETSGIDLCLFPAGSFNLVYSYVAFQHMPSQVFERYLEETNRVLQSHGYFAFQIPIGLHQNAPLGDTMGMRTYSQEDISDKLERSGFQLVEERNSKTSTSRGQEPHETSPFMLAKKTSTSQPAHVTDWVNTECGGEFSLLDTRMWLWFAEQCLHEGRQEEALNTYKSLLEQDPRSLESWNRIVEQLIETGMTKEAQSTLEKLKDALPMYTKLNALLKTLK